MLVAAAITEKVPEDSSVKRCCSDLFRAGGGDKHPLLADLEN